MANPPEEPGNGVAENSDVVQQLKASNAHFRDLIEKNKALYHAIEDSQKGAGAQDPTARKKLERVATVRARPKLTQRAQAIDLGHFSTFPADSKWSENALEAERVAVLEEITQMIADAERG